MSATETGTPDASPSGQVYDGEGKRPAVLLPANAGPLVSCLMVSRGDERILRNAVRCYMRQSYADRELVVVLQEATPALRGYFEDIGGATDRIRIVEAPGTLTLGGLRNLAVAAAEGAFVCQWDDDDLHHPRYLEFMAGFVAANGADAAFLNRWTVWWPARRLFAVSGFRVWEGSMLCRRSAMPVYADMERGEDAAVAAAIFRDKRTVLVSAPDLYVYTVTGHNSWPAAHMEVVISEAGSRQFPEAEYDRRLAALDADYDIADYDAYCRGG